MKKRSLIAVLCAILIVTLLPVSAFAADKAGDPFGPLKLSATKVVFDKKMSSDTYYISIPDNSSVFLWAKTANPSVATAKVSSDSKWVLVTPKKAGKTVIHITDNMDRKKDVTVTVKKSWVKAYLKNNSQCSVNYGFKKADVTSLPGTKVTIKIGGKKFTKKVGKSGQTTINLKKTFKYGKKYKVTFKYGGVSYTKTQKVKGKCYLYVQRMNPNSNEIKVNVFYGVKGDKVTLSVFGVPYVKTIKKTKTKQTLTFRTAYWNGTIEVVNLIVKNKYGQLLYMIDSPNTD